MGEAIGVIVAEKIRMARLCAAMLRIGLIGFGGGNALVPVIEREAVERQGLVTKGEYDELIVAANLTPGALPVELAAGVGALTFGAQGMVLGAIFMALPGAILTLLLLSVLASAQGTALELVQYLSIAIGAFIVYMLVGYGARVLRSAYQESRRLFTSSVAIMLLVFAAVGVKNIYFFLGLGKPSFSLSVVEVLAIAFSVLGLISLKNTDLTLAGLRENIARLLRIRQPIARIVVIWSAFALAFALPAIIALPEASAYLGRGLLSSLISFGGGDAYLTIADGLFVESGVITGEAFFSQIVPVVNILPGSILVKTLTGIGFVYGAEFSAFTGLLLASAGFAVSVAASGLVFGIALELIRAFREVALFQLVSRWIRPIIAGLLLNVALSLVKAMVLTGTALLSI